MFNLRIYINYNYPSLIFKMHCLKYFHAYTVNFCLLIQFVVPSIYCSFIWLLWCCAEFYDDQLKIMEHMYSKICMYYIRGRLSLCFLYSCWSIGISIPSVRSYVSIIVKSSHKHHNQNLQSKATTYTINKAEQVWYLPWSLKSVKIQVCSL